MLKPTKIKRYLPRELVMPPLKLTIVLIALTLLSGCAHHVGYQRSYVGYGSTYRTPSYYDYPSTTYYQSSPIIYYDRHYTSPRHFDHQDWDKHRHGNRKDWRPSQRRDYTPQWKPNMPRAHQHEHERHRSGARPQAFDRNRPDRSRDLRNHFDQGSTRREGHGRREHTHRGD